MVGGIEPGPELWALNDKPGRPNGHRWATSTPYVLVALLVAALVWIGLFLVRLHAHQPNVDDYYYAQLSKHLFSSNFLSRFFDTGQDSPLVPALAAPGSHVAGLYGALAIELPVLLLLTLGAFVLARTWISRPAAMVTALVVSLNAAVLGYSMMLNFALAATASVVWVFATYFRCDGLRSWSWNLGLGVATTSLLLSRTISIVYAAPLALVIFVDFVQAFLRTRRGPKVTAWLAIGPPIMVAGLWWATSGGQAIHYLRNAGYQASSGFTNRGLVVTPHAIFDRAKWELANMGWLQSLGLGAAILLALWLVPTRTQQLSTQRMWLLAAWAVLVVLILSTSGNQGTAFGLPVVAVLILLSGAIIGQIHFRWTTAGLVALVGLLGVGIAAEASAWTSLWWPGPPYRQQAIHSGGNRLTNIEGLNSQVGAALMQRHTLLVREDDLVNANSLRYVTAKYRVPIVIPPYNSSGTSAALQKLPNASALITGMSPGMYDPSLNQQEVQDAAERQGFTLDRAWRLAPNNTVMLWVRS